MITFFGENNLTLLYNYKLNAMNFSRILQIMIGKSKNKTVENDGDDEKPHNSTESRKLASKELNELSHDEFADYIINETLSVDIDEGLKKLRQCRESWDIEHESIFSHRNEAMRHDKQGDNQKALTMYLENIEMCKNSNHFNNLNNFSYAIERVIILYGKEKEKGLLKRYLESLIKEYPKSKEVLQWKTRLQKLTATAKDITITSDNIAIPERTSEKSIGARINEIKKNFPEFNWYYDMPEDMGTFMYLLIHNTNTSAKSNPHYKEWGRLEDTFVKLSQKANLAESGGDYKTAIGNYLKMVVEECESTIPYERLMVIYRKLKWKEQEIDIIQKAIDFFTQLRSKQADYILCLGDKYGMRDKAQSYIDENKKVFYYGGAFELYNPQPKIEKWKERLSKLEK